MWWWRHTDHSPLRTAPIVVVIVVVVVVVGVGVGVVVASHGWDPSCYTPGIKETRMKK